MFKSFSLSIKLPLTIVGLVLLAISVIVSVQSYTTQKMVEEEAMLKAEEMAFRYANDIDAYLEVALDSARTLAQVFETATDKSTGFAVGREQANAILRELLEKNTEFLGVWTCWEPDAFDGLDMTFKETKGHDDTGRFVPYWYRKDGKIDITALVDYANKGAGDYYQLARDSGVETIVEPYEYEVEGRKILLTSVAVPIHDANEERVLGVVGIDIDLNNINKIVTSVRPYDTGWGTLLSHTGIIAANPKSDRIGKRFSDYGDPELRRRALQKIGVGESFREIETDKERGTTIFKVFVPIWFGKTTTPWCFMINMPENEVLATVHNLVISSIYLGLGVAFVATLAAIFFARRITGPIRRLVCYAETVSKGDLAAKNDIKRSDEIGVLAGVIGQMVENLKEKSYWYENILNAIPFPVSVTDNDMNWTFLNKAVEELAKVKASDMIGKHCSNWNANICNTTDCGIRCAERGKGQGRSYFTQPQFLDKAFMVDASFIYDKQGEKIGHIEVIQDITEASILKLKAEQAMKEGILQAAKQLELVVEVVTSASEELSAQIEQSSRGSEHQSNQISATATSMEEMNATVLEVAKNASKAAETSDKAKRKAEDGSLVVTQVVKGIGDVQSSALELKTDMTALGKQAVEIGQILDVISDIADQTNLLALNAAIEAARAGDAGRGFAVVADEVRKLAEKTMTATKEVGDAIRGIQEGARKNITNVENAVSKIDAATCFAGKSGEALNEIVSLVDMTTDQVRSIATASEQQSAASEEINRSIEDVNRISSETSDAMRQSAQAVGELAQQAQVLKRLIDQMKAEGNVEAGSAKSPGAVKL